MSYYTYIKRAAQRIQQKQFVRENERKRNRKGDTEIKSITHVRTQTERSHIKTDISSQFEHFAAAQTKQQTNIYNITVLS